MPARRNLILIAAVALVGALSCTKLGPDSTTAGRTATSAPAFATPNQAASTPQAAAESAPGAAPGSAAKAAAPSPAPAAVVRRLVRTVDLALTVGQTKRAAEQLERLATRLGGYVATVDAERQDDVMRWSLTLRVPPERLDEALATAKSLALSVDREQQRVEDVTDAYIDLDARLRTLSATETELRGLLAESRQRQLKADEVMSIYRELTEIRSQSERLKGQLVALDKLIAFSTLNVTLTPAASARPVAAEGWHPNDTLRGSLRTLVSMLRGFGDFLIFAVVVLLPAAILLTLIVWPARLAWRRLRRARTAIDARGDGDAQAPPP